MTLRQALPMRGFVPQKRIDNNCSGKSQKRANEIKNSHNLIYLVNTIMLIVHIKNAVLIPKITKIVFSEALGEMMNGRTIDAKKICPRFANILEMFFICSGFKT